MRPLALSARQHWLCITGASPLRHLAVFRGIAVRDEAAWLSQIHQPKARRGEESGLEACYRKSPGDRAFSLGVLWDT
jgi:hypothetical protein